MSVIKTIKLYTDKEYIDALVEATNSFVERKPNRDTKAVLLEFESIQKLCLQETKQ
jgi:gentisate 1,2-dioxygenase